MMALWPTGMYGEIDGGRVIDSGQLISWHSYPESDHAHSVPIDEAGPDYTGVPTDEHGKLHFERAIIPICEPVGCR
jgi:hypothetical protein